MNISREWCEQNRGVSPVIGVILMVAITVILAAVIGTFVLNMSDRLNESPPNTQFEFEQNNVSVTMMDTRGGTASPTHRVVNITHIGGEQIDKSNLRVTVGGMQAYAVFDVYQTNTHQGWAGSMPFEAFAKPNEPVTAGDQTTLLTRVDADEQGGDAWTADDLIEPGVSDHSHYYTRTGDSSDIAMGNSNGNNPGDSGVYGGTGILLHPGETVRVIWSSGDGPGTVLTEYEITDNS